MQQSEISPGVKYLSIHDVPYLVIAVKDDVVKARCDAGRHSGQFNMPLDLFAAAMKAQAK